KSVNIVGHSGHSKPSSLNDGQPPSLELGGGHMEVTGGQDVVLVFLGEKSVEDDSVLGALAFDLFGEVFSLGAATDDVDPQAGEGFGELVGEIGHLRDTFLHDEAAEAHHGRLTELLWRGGVVGVFAWSVHPP